MKAVCFVDVEKVEVREIPDPHIELPTDAIVKVSTAGLCGSDLHVYHGRETGMDVGTVMGHELVGEIVEVGSEVTQFRVGDRVACAFTTSCGDCFYCQHGLSCRCESGQLFGWCCNGIGLQGAQSEYVRVALADGTLKKIAPNFSDEVAILLGDNLSTGFYSAELANVAPQGTYVVIGCGTVGLLTILAAKHRGAATIYAIDLAEHRRRIASEMGAITFSSSEEVLEAVQETTAGRGADAVMELVGLPPAQQLAFDLLRPGGILSVIGCHTAANFSFSPVEAYDKNLTLKTGRCPARIYMDKLEEFAGCNQKQLESLVTHRFGVAQAVMAYDIFANRKDRCLKAVLKF